MRRLEVARGERQRIDHFLDALGLERGHGLGDVAIHRQDGRRLRRQHRRAVRHAERLLGVLAELADRADVARDLEQALLLLGGERRLAHDDRAHDRLPGRVAARRALVDLALENFLVVDLLDEDRRLILGVPDRGRAAARAARLAIERQHGQQRPHDGSVGGADEGDLQDVAIVQQLGAFDDRESVDSSGMPSSSSACGVTASCIMPPGRRRRPSRR